MTSSPVTPVDNENMASLIKWDDEEGEVQEEKKTRQMRMDQYKTRPIQLRYYNPQILNDLPCQFCNSSRPVADRY